MAIAYKLIDFSSPWANAFELFYIKMYYIYFIGGVITKMYLNRINQLIENKYYLFLIFLLVFVLPYTLVNIHQIIVVFSRIFAIYAIFYHFRDTFDKKGTIATRLSIIGKHTLEIYLLHFFLLMRFPWAENAILSITNDSCFGGSSNSWLLELILVGSISIAYCFICIYIRKLIDVFPIVSELCFGPTKKSKVVDNEAY